MDRTTFALFGIGLVLVGALIGQWLYEPSPVEPDADVRQTLRSAYDVIRESYVEPVPPESLTTNSIEAMMSNLDSFSGYISPERMRQVEETFEGSFEGIGISYELIDGAQGQDTIAVMSVIPGGPSAEAGLRAGDRIVGVEGQSATGWSHEKVQNRLKGPKGSSVTVTLRRPGTDDRLKRTITRDTVPLETVQASYMMDEGTGYVRVSRFARTTHQEFTEAVQELRGRGMDRLVFDLRGNAGGLMSMAEKLADEFLVEGQLIVQARSRHEEYAGSRYATSDGLLHDLPVVVLVDEHSASASEIVAGALQDHDRGVLVGRPTFGKGLIQRQFDLGDSSGLRITVARFHTPSGRLLQRTPDRERDSLLVKTEDGRSQPSPQLPDSLVYRTDAGRLVVGGGGIRPDRFVADSTSNRYRRAVETKGIIHTFARQWIDAHNDSLRTHWGDRREAFANEYQLPSTVYPAFVGYAEEKGVAAAGRILATVEAGGDGGASSRSGSASDAAYTRDEVQAARDEIETILKAHIGQRLFGPSMMIRILNTIDPTVQEAKEAWPVASDWADRYPIK